METIRRNRVTSGIIGGAIVLIVLAVLLSGGGDGEPGFDPAAFNPSSSPTATGSAAPAGSNEEFARTDVPKLDCEPLLTTEEEEEGLGVSDLPFSARGTFTVSGSETCTVRLTSNQDIFVQITPGTPADFEAGIQRLGVTGELTQGVGDGAVWFGGPDSSEGGRAGVLSVAENTSLGLLVFRIVLGRPDLDEAAQLEVAKMIARHALPRFPGVEPPPPPPPAEPRVVPVPAPPDTSSSGYVENLIEREADGDWTLGEGLVASLGILVGETAPGTVLRSPDLFDFSSRLIDMARTYLDEGEDAAARAELARLLDRLVQVPSAAEIAEARPLFASAGSARLVAFTTTIQEQPCTPYFEDPETCLGRSYVEPDIYGVGTFVLTGPESGYGWDQADHDTAKQAMADSLAVLYGLEIPPPPTILMMVPDGGVGGIYQSASDSSGCVAFIGTDFQSLGRAHQAQAVAYLMANCSLRSMANFPAGSLGLGPWREAGAWFLSDVVYEDADLEVKRGLPTVLAEIEIYETMPAYDEGNWAFLEHVGIGGALDTLKRSAADLKDQTQTLHDHAKRLTEGALVDRGGTHGYTPPSTTESLSNTGTVTFPVPAFQALRLEITVDGGDYACVSFPANGNAIVSWSPSSVGDAGSWSQQLPPTLDGVATFVATAASDTQFSISVEDFVSDPDDCDEDNETNSPASPSGGDCGLCGASDFFYRIFNFKPGQG